MDTEQVAFLILGATIVFVVGQLISRNGRRYIAADKAVRRAAAPGANMVAALFHLAALGLLALLAVLPLGGSAEQRFLLRLGILLIVLAAVYGIVLAQLNRRRVESVATELEVRRDPGEISYGVGPEARVEPARVEPPND